MEHVLDHRNAQEFCDSLGLACQRTRLSIRAHSNDEWLHKPPIMLHHALFAAMHGHMRERDFLEHFRDHCVLAEHLVLEPCDFEPKYPSRCPRMACLSYRGTHSVQKAQRGRRRFSSLPFKKKHYDAGEVGDGMGSSVGELQRSCGRDRAAIRLDGVRRQGRRDVNRRLYKHGCCQFKEMGYSWCWCFPPAELARDSASFQDSCGLTNLQVRADARRP